MTVSPDTLYIKHLEFLQVVIGRMGNTSSLIKGWLVTLTTAMLAVAVERGSWPVAASTLIPLVTFWAVDGFFLRQERLYRRFYDAVRRREDNDDGPLSMNASRYRSEMAWRSAVYSVSLVAFYGTVLLVDVVFIVWIALLA